MAAPNPLFTVAGSSSGAPAVPASIAPKKKKNRGSRKKKNRRKSFALNNDDMDHDEAISSSIAAPSQGFYGQHHNLSGTSIDSENLLDHRYVSSVFVRALRGSSVSGLGGLTLGPQRTTLFYARSTTFKRRPVTGPPSSVAEHNEAEKNKRRGQ